MARNKKNPISKSQTLVPQPKQPKSQAVKLATKLDRILLCKFTIDMPTVVKTISKLPETIIRDRFSCIPDWEKTSKETLLFERIKRKYNDISLWLKFHLLHEHHLLPIIVQPITTDAQDWAEIAMNYYGLAKQIFIHENPQIVFCPDNSSSCVKICPNYWMFLCVLEICYNDIKGGNLLKDYGEPATTKPLGKVTSHKILKNHFDWLEERADGDSLAVRQSVHKLIPVNEIESAIFALEQHALMIARNDRNFRRGHFHEYCQIMRRCLRNMNKPGNSYRVTYLDDSNNLIRLEQGKDGRTSSKSDKAKRRSLQLSTE